MNSVLMILPGVMTLTMSSDNISVAKMKAALQEKDPQKQEHNVYEANNGNYYEKYAAMCGMIYLGQQWQSGAISRLKELFDLGYHGFAVKSAGL